MSPSKPLVNVTAFTILVAFLAAMGIGAIEHDWTPLIAVIPLMTLLGGYVFTDKLISRQRENGNGVGHKRDH